MHIPVILSGSTNSKGAESGGTNVEISVVFENVGKCCIVSQMTPSCIMPNVAC